VNDYLANHDQVAGWLQRLAGEGEVLLPCPVGGKNFAFAPLLATTPVRFDRYLPTVAPPARHLLPADETIFTYERDADGNCCYAAAQPPQPMILAGVRPCDLQAIAHLDAVMIDAPADPLYLARRAVTTVIGVNCLSPCDERCFCAAVGALHCRQGADIFLTPAAAGMLVEVLTERGAALVASAGFATCDDAAGKREAAEGQRPQVFGRKLATEPGNLPGILREGYRSPLYAHHGSRCFSCGTCNLVCPTCYCFEMKDDLALDGMSGRRSRTWDACMIPAFAEVAGGHNFRPEVGERQRHRLKRKFEYLPERFGSGPFCVGCGRCGRQCTADIDILTMVNEIVAETGGAA